ncbi:MAG: hypothetical protein AB7S65_04385 [Sulfuricurvum sp.]
MLIVTNIVVLLLQIKGLSISYNEAEIVYGDSSFLHWLIHFSLSLFGQTDYALRLPMLLLHLCSVLLLYEISGYYLKRNEDRLWLLVFYILLPGVTSAALIVDDAGLTIASLFLFTYLHLRYGRYALWSVPLLMGINPSFVYLFFGLLLYGVIIKDKTYLAVGSISLSVMLYINGMDIGGIPKGHFLDLLALYAAIFSPIVFIYLFYVLYRRLITREWDLLWSIAMSAFFLSIILSFRQKIAIQTFAPFVMLALPLAAQTFLTTYRLRLREFRGRYYFLFIGAFVLLALNALAVFFNYHFYKIIDKPSHHFAYPMHVAGEMAVWLKKNGIQCIDADDQAMQLRLRFYGITQCRAYQLQNDYVPTATKVTISYNKKAIATYYVSKVNN